MEVQRPPLPSLTVEVQSHVAANTVRCLSLGIPTGIRRGLVVTDTGAPLTTRVGDDVLGARPENGQGSSGE